MEEVIRATNVTLVIPKEGRKGSSRTATFENTKSALKYGKVKYNLTPYTNAGPFNLKDLLV